MASKKRHPSQDRPSRASSTSPLGESDPFDDENDIESFGVADGFQSSFNLQNIPSTTQQGESKPSNTRTKSSVFRDTKKKPPSAQDNTSSLIARNSFSLRHDAQYSDHPRPRLPSVSSTVGPTQQTDARPVSMISRQSTYVRPESTYNGPSAPSHPYEMYPQNSTEMARRASAASTNRPTRERSYHGRDRPTHPYAMYPQNPVSDTDTETLDASTDIASVGFPGLNHQYARRLGPDGEEADDIIGPDGHTEQLPPYSRYANIGPMVLKRDSHIANGPLSAIPADTASLANDATSMSDTLLSPTAYDSTVRLASSETVNTPSKEKWNKRTRRKTCFGRLPVWAVVLMIVLLILSSAALGAVIGRLLNKGKKPADSQPSADNSTLTPSTSTISIDPSMPTLGVTPLPPDTPQPPIPASIFGPYDLALLPPTNDNATCLPQNQQPVWDCMADSETMKFNVSNPVVSPGNVILAPAAGLPLMYGGQLPSFQSNFTATLSLDPNNKSAGHALYFSTTYQKQVILKYEADVNLSAPSKRSIDDARYFEGQQLDPRNKRAQNRIDEKALVWNCLWPGTNVDGFIFIDIDVNATLIKPVNSPVISNNYPRKVQLREYRVQGSPKASCTIMENNGGTLVPPTTVQGNPVSSFVLQESDPPPPLKVGMANWGKGGLSYEKRDGYQGYCFCELANA